MIGTTSQKVAMKCSFCQNEILAGATDCAHCGAHEQQRLSSRLLYNLTYLAAIALGIWLGIASRNLLIVVFLPIFVALLGRWILAWVWPKKTVWARKQQVVVVRR